MDLERFDYGKGFVVKTIFLNDRLKTYQYYLNTALENGYEICSMVEFYENLDNGKHFVLRHDVDHMGQATKKMFNTERKMGVHSTYYFRKSTIDVPLMNEMIDSGFEVGFHYETLSDYAIENNLSNVSENDIELCRLRLKEEISEFNRLINKPVQSIVSHGSNKNFEIGKSNNVLLENQSCSDFGILFEGYDEQIYNSYVDVHIMDDNIRNNSGFYYSSNPLDAIASGKQNIIFLSHPHHWYKSFFGTCREFIALICGRYRPDTPKEFSRILK